MVSLWAQKWQTRKLIKTFPNRDFDPAETVSEKMTKFFDVKGVKGFKKLMKEIAVTASTGKHDNELIGRCNIPLRVN